MTFLWVAMGFSLEIPMGYTILPDLGQVVFSPCSLPRRQTLWWWMRLCLGSLAVLTFVINILRSKLLDLNIPGHASISQWKFLCSSLFFKNTWVYRSESSTMTSSLAFPPGPCRNLKAHVVTKQTHRCHFSDLHHTFLYLDLKSQHLYNG